MHSPNDWDSLSLSSSTSSSNSSVDEEDINSRVSPTWEKYRCLLHRKGFGLETIRDVKEYHQCPGKGVETHYNDYYSRYKRVSSSSDDSALCKDRGLCDNLFRGTHYCTGRKVIIKAVHLRGREFDIIRFLSTPPIRHDPMNHCIPILDLIEVPKDDIGFIVMEEWSSNLIPETPCCLDKFLDALTQCIEHIAFMHKYRIAHLDISLHNLLTDYKGHYACIDYEISRRYDDISPPRIYANYRGTEIPPELEQNRSSDPYKVDVWALGVLVIRACKLTGYCVPELADITKAMLNENPDKRPSTAAVLQAFRRVVTTIAKDRLAYCTPQW